MSAKFPHGVEGHVVSMKHRYEGQAAFSVALCECGWTCCLPVADYRRQDSEIEMSRKELKRAKRELDWLNTGNSGWLTYRLRDSIRELVQDKIRNTDGRRRQRLLPL
jgi:hypothetical protein